MPGPAWASAQSLDAQFQSRRKALWAWHMDVASLKGLSELSKTWGIDTVFISMTSETVAAVLKQEESVMREFTLLDATGVRLFALTGDPIWLKSPNVVPETITTLTEIVKECSAFEGIALDIEPHTLQEWRRTASEREKLMASAVELFSRIREHAPGLSIDGAIHPTYAALSFGEGRNFLENVAVALSSVSIMAYRVGLQASIHLATDAIEVLSGLKKPWRFGVLVHETNEPRTSYFGIHRDQFLKEMVLLDDMLGPQSAEYCGLIFEDYTGIRSLLR